MSRMFVDRNNELKFLENRWNSKNFEFIVLYGRRRIGKTFLIKRFVKGKPFIYFLCDKKGTKENIDRFKKSISFFLREPVIATYDLEEIFTYFIKRFNKRVAIIFDEFQYLVEKDKSIPSVFQRVIDNILINSKIMLILCGSSISMMEKGILSRKSPLYGRKTGHWKIERLPFSAYFEFYPKNTIEKNVEFFSVTSGVPFYMEKFDPEKPVLENVKEEIASKSGRLFEELDFLLREELREPDVYKKILEGISKGKTKISEIASFSGIEINKLFKYLKVLMNLRFVERERIVTERKVKSKKTRYYIKDNFIDFYMKFVEQFKSDLEIFIFDSFKRNFITNFNKFVGLKFESLIRDEIFRNIFSDKFERVGRWWGFIRENGERKQVEIDIVALNEQTKEILFAECKWQTRVNAKKIVKELAEKSQYVNWHNDKRKETFAIFAKSFSKRIKEFEGKKVYCFDLKEMERVLKK